jgi:hypothetical protein
MCLARHDADISAEVLRKGGEPMLVFFCGLLDLFWWLRD